MATLKLRNCTHFQLAYWRSIAFHRTNYVAPGQEGTYKWGATYTLKVKRSADSPSGENSRAAVNQGGIYYAYWANNKVDILDEKQIKGVVSNEDNPFVEKWVSPPQQQYNFPVAWRLAASKQNNSNTPIQFEYVEKYGFQVKHSSTNRLTVTDSAQTSVKVGAEFEIKDVKITGTTENTITHQQEKFEETMSEETVYGENQHSQNYVLNPGDSLAIWQAQVNIWGNTLDLDHIAYSKVGEGPPELPKFDPVSTDALIWS